jgi:acyl-CoA synthetase (AMP-forming)/AMP-acid ligase II
MLQWRSARHADRVAYYFLRDGEHVSESLTYGCVHRRALVACRHLLDLGLQGERVVLAFPPGLEFITALFGCIYAGVIAVPANTPRRSAGLGRLEAIAHDSQARAILGTADVRQQVQKLIPEESILHDLKWIDFGSVPDNDPDSWQPSECTPESIAFLQYTSGSTAVPRGVIVTHGNLLHNLHLICNGFGHRDGSRGVMWLPLFHDMGLIGGVLEPLYIGGCCYLLSPTIVFSNPYMWLRAVSEYRATTSGGPNFAFELCARRISAQQRATLDLSNWEVAFCGSEPIQPESLERFANVFEPCGFRPEAFLPCYGLAESTLIVTSGARAESPTAIAICRSALRQGRVEPPARDRQGDVQQLVGCGTALKDQKLLIVDPQTLRRCPPDRTGEIWLQGPSVARGYWRKREATEQTFGAYVADTGEGPFLRTGDIGFVRDGELFVVGRLKEVIIVRGRNHWPQDIERTAAAVDPAFDYGCCTAFALEGDGGERLVVVQEIRPRPSLDFNRLGAAIQAAVGSDHEVDLHAVCFVKPGGVPRTSSGKLRRLACRDAYSDGSLPVVHLWKAASPTTESPPLALTRHALLLAAPADRSGLLQSHLRDCLAAALGIAACQLDVEQPINYLGLDSLKCLELKHSLDRDLAVDVPLVGFFRGDSIRRMAEQLIDEIENSGLTVPRQVQDRRLAHLLQKVESLDEAGIEMVLAGNSREL